MYTQYHMSIYLVSEWHKIHRIQTSVLWSTEINSCLIKKVKYILFLYVCTVGPGRKQMAHSKGKLKRVWWRNYLQRCGQALGGPVRDKAPKESQREGTISIRWPEETKGSSFWNLARPVTMRQGCLMGARALGRGMKLLPKATDRRDCEGRWNKYPDLSLFPSCDHLPRPPN